MAKLHDTHQPMETSELGHPDRVRIPNCHQHVEVSDAQKGYDTIDREPVWMQSFQSTSDGALWRNAAPPIASRGVASETAGMLSVNDNITDELDALCPVKGIPDLPGGCIVDILTSNTYPVLDVDMVEDFINHLESLGNDDISLQRLVNVGKSNSRIGDLKSNHDRVVDGVSTSNTFDAWPDRVPVHDNMFPADVSVSSDMGANADDVSVVSGMVPADVDVLSESWVNGMSETPPAVLKFPMVLRPLPNKISPASMTFHDVNINNPIMFPDISVTAPNGCGILSARNENNLELIEAIVSLL